MRSQHSFYMDDELYRQLRVYAIERGQTASDVLAEMATRVLAGAPPVEEANGTEPASEPLETHPAPKVIKTPTEAAAAVSLLDREFHPVPKPTPAKRRTRR